MLEKNGATSRPPLLERFELDLADAKEKEEAAKLQVDVAKELLSLARGDCKRLVKAIDIYSGRRSSSLTKRSIFPIVQRLLSAGPLPESEVKKGVEAELKAKQIARTGLALILKSLRAENSCEGVWSLNLNPEAEQASNNK